MKFGPFTFIVLSFLLTPTLVSFGQEANTGGYRIHIAPLNLLDPYTGVVQIGVQKRFSRRLALVADYGLQFNPLSRKSDGREDYSYHKFKAELKYFVRGPKLVGKRRHKLVEPYYSFQAFYMPQRYHKLGGYIIRDGESYRYDRSDINRKAFSFSLLIGEEITRGRFTIDQYIGVGYRLLKIRHRTVGEVPGFEEPTDWFNDSPADERESLLSRPHFPMGIKIGYNLARRTPK